MITEQTYKHNEKEHNVNAAAEIVPYLIELFQPKSILDVGCGIGTWLHQFKKEGIKNILGVDIPFVDKNLLLKYLNETEFKAVDLSRPFSLGAKFDLVISLEVAEHLPESSALEFVHSLTRHSDVIIFSAAIPYQEGQNHLNEQWPEYWQTIFNKFGYVAYDFIRDAFWDNEKVDIWYRQNIMLYAKPGLLQLHQFEPAKGRLTKVHPDLFVLRMKKLKHTQEKLKNFINNPKPKSALKLLFRSIRK